jgi:hypothetical protein
MALASTFLVGATACLTMGLNWLMAAGDSVSFVINDLILITGSPAEFVYGENANYSMILSLIHEYGDVTEKYELFG